MFSLYHILIVHRRYENIRAFRCDVSNSSHQTVSTNVINNTPRQERRGVGVGTYVPCQMLSCCFKTEEASAVGQTESMRNKECQ